MQELTRRFCGDHIAITIRVALSDGFFLIMMSTFWLTTSVVLLVVLMTGWTRNALTPEFGFAMIFPPILSAPVITALIRRETAAHPVGRLRDDIRLGEDELIFCAASTGFVFFVYLGIYVLLEINTFPIFPKLASPFVEFFLVLVVAGFVAILGVARIAGCEQPVSAIYATLGRNMFSILTANVFLLAFALIPTPIAIIGMFSTFWFIDLGIVLYPALAIAIYLTIAVSFYIAVVRLHLQRDRFDWPPLESDGRP